MKQTNKQNGITFQDCIQFYYIIHPWVWQIWNNQPHIMIWSYSTVNAFKSFSMGKWLLATHSTVMVRLQFEKLPGQSHLSIFSEEPDMWFPNILDISWTHDWKLETSLVKLKSSPQLAKQQIDFLSQEERRERSLLLRIRACFYTNMILHRAPLTPKFM